MKADLYIKCMVSYWKQRLWWDSQTIWRVKPPPWKTFAEKRVGQWEKGCTNCSQAAALSQNPDKTERQRGRDKNRFFFFTSLESILHISHVSLHGILTPRDPKANLLSSISRTRKLKLSGFTKVVELVVIDLMLETRSEHDIRASCPWRTPALKAENWSLLGNESGWV